MAKRAKPEPKETPKPSTETLVHEAGLSILAWDYRTRSGREPLHMTGDDGKTFVLFSPADTLYGFDGWVPHHDGMNGGRYRTIESALAWVHRARDVRAGKATDFLGV
jgi:hypothetical protein